jgi:hypothetical protein
MDIILMELISQLRLELEQIKYEILLLERVEYLRRRRDTTTSDRNRGMTPEHSPSLTPSLTLVKQRRRPGHSPSDHFLRGRLKGEEQ